MESLVFSAIFSLQLLCNDSVILLHFAYKLSNRGTNSPSSIILVDNIIEHVHFQERLETQTQKNQCKLFSSVFIY